MRNVADRYFANTKVYIKTARANVVITAGGSVYQLDENDSQRRINTLWLPKQNKMMIELLDGSVFHLLKGKEGIICEEEQAAPAIVEVLNEVTV